MTTRLPDAADHAAELTPYLRFWVFGWRNDKDGGDLGS